MSELIEADCAVKSSGISVRVFADPFSDDYFDGTVAPGQTIAQIIGRDDLSAVVFADGRVIECEEWHVVVPQSSMIVRRLPAGEAGRIIGTIAIIALAAWAGPILAGLAFGGSMVSAGFMAAASAVFTAGIGIAGALLLNALIPPPSLPSIGSSPQQLSFLTGSSNQVAPFSPIPNLYGRMRYFPPIPMTGLPYTELVGQDQYFRAMLVLGYGPLQIGGVSTASGVITQATSLSGSPIRIGDTPISSFQDVEFQIGTADQCTLYTNSIVEQQVNVNVPRTGPPATDLNQLIADGDTYVRTTDPDTDEVSLDLYFPTLITMRSDGRTRVARVTFQVHCRPAASSDSWTALTTTWTVSSSERDPIRVGRRFVLPSQGQWEIRLTRSSTFLGAGIEYTDCTWTTLRSIKRNVRPFDVPGVVVMALRIRASDQLGGRLERVSVEATRILPVWDGDEWVNQATRNPAWAYVDVLTGSATRTPIDKARIDVTEIEEWAEWCDDEGLKCDMVIDAAGTVFDRARDVASTGLGSWHVASDGTISVVRDRVVDSVMLLSPRNVAGFSSDFVYHRLPHALRMQFIDPDRWEQTELVVYADGYDAGTATIYETMPLIGVTDPAQAWKMGRYHLAQLTLRPETYYWEHDIQHLIYQRGDSVDLAHDVILVGMQWARITRVESTTEIEVDEVIQMESGPSYGVRIQRSDGSMTTVGVDTVLGGTRTLDLTGAVSDLSAGDHLVFGVLGNEAIKAKITRIEPRGNFRARIIAVPSADDIFDAWTGEIPEFDPVITSPIDLDRISPPIPEITSVLASEESSVPDADGSVRVRIIIAYRMPPGLTGVTVEARMRRVATIESEDYISEWRVVGSAPSDRGFIVIPDAEEEIEYEVQLRSVRGSLASSWTASSSVGIDPFDLIRPAPSVTYNRPNIWRRAPNGGAWTPSETTVDGTVEFVAPGGVVATRVMRATLDTATGAITVASQSTSGASTSISTAGSGTGSVATTVTHDASGVSAVLNWVSVVSGTDGADGSGVTILGTLAEEADLEDIVSPDPGDAYIIDGDLWVWDGSDWVNVGQIQGPPGADGDDGLSVAELVIYRRASSAPSTPTGGSFDFGTQILTPPSSWSIGVPSGTDPVYTSRAVAYIVGQAGSFSSFTWSSPVLAFQDGESTDIIFRRSASQPTTPSPSSGVPASWYSDVASVPGGSDPLWSSFGTRSNSGANWTWQTPVQIEGSTGAPGLDGLSGSGTLNIGYAMSRLSAWRANVSFTTALQAEWSVVTAATPIHPQHFRVVSNANREMYSERIPCDPNANYRVSVWAKQPTGNRRNYFLVVFRDADGNSIQANTSGMTGWASLGTYFYWGRANQTIPDTWTQYTFEFGPGRTGQIPSAAVAMQIGALCTYPAASDSVETTVDITDLRVMQIGFNGINTAPVLIYRRNATSPALPSATATYTFATGGITGLNNSWTATVPAANGQPLWVAHASASGTGATDTIASGEWSSPAIMAEDGADGSDGADGNNTAVAYLYQRAASSPGAPANTLTYTFATGALTGTPGGGWSTTIPATDGNPLWVRTAVAFGTGATDSITAGEWSASVRLVEDGAAGAAGLNNAPVLIYRRNATSPALPSATATYTFATGGITGLNNSWTATVPAANGNPLWVAHASASGTGATDTIASGEWSSPAIMAEDGAAGGNTAVAYLYQRSASSPGAPANSLTYTFATGALTGTPGGGWSTTIPATDGNPLWVRTAVAFGTGATDSITAGEWSASVRLVEDGADGADGADGLDAQHYAYNPTFEQGDVGWDAGGSITIASDSATARLGSFRAARTTTGDGARENTRRFPAQSGMRFGVTGWVRSTSGAGFTAIRWVIRWYNSSNTLLSALEASYTGAATTTYQFVSAYGAAPANTSYGKLTMQVIGQTSGTVYWDESNVVNIDSVAMNILLGGTFTDFMEIASSGSVYSGKSTYGSAADGWWIGRDGGEPGFHFGGERYIRFKPSTGLEQNAANLTVSASDYATGALTVTSDSTWVEIVTADLDTGGNRVFIMFSALGGPNGAAVDVEVRRGSTVLASFTHYVTGVNTMMSFNVGEAAPPDGVNTYAVYMKKPNAGTTNSGWSRRSIMLMGSV